MHCTRKTAMIALILTLLSVAAAQPPIPQPSPFIPDPAFCASPPVVSSVSLPDYTGRWYQLYTSGQAGRFSSNQCVTANYTLRADGNIDVLNCQLPIGGTRSQCIEGLASRRPNGTEAQLQVQFGGGPPGPYNIAVLLGDKNHGYFAAAIYNCQGAEQSIFVIARTPFLKEVTLGLVVEEMKEVGYVLDDVVFDPSGVGSECVYFDSGFDVGPPMVPDGFDPTTSADPGVIPSPDMYIDM